MPDRHDALLFAAATLAEAEVVVLGLPYDGTASFHPGSRFGPAAVRQASQGLELYSPALGRSLATRRVHDAGDVAPAFGEARAFLERAEAEVARLVRLGKVVALVGGDHSVSLAGIRALAAVHRDLAVLQFDAHLDLRPEYLGEVHSHASVMHHALRLVGPDRLAQLGVRSGEEEEFRRSPWWREELAVDEAVRRLGPYPVYLTVDIDVLDPSVAPGTGTPEPGGVGFAELARAAVAAARALDVVAFDVVEVCPPQDPSGITAMAAAKLLRELILAVTGRREGR